jgi:23S rRNA (uridine2552-2'-O)-methyltransferase
MYRKDKKTEFYTQKAKEQNYPARSVYKLGEIDKKYKIFKKGDSVLDLGCFPGSWLLYIAEKIGENGCVIGIDVEKIKIPLKKNISFINKSIFEFREPDFKSKFDSIVSDMAPKTTGVDFIDAGKSFELSQEAFRMVKLFLKPGGNFVCKIFDSQLSQELFREVQKSFEFSKRFKPKAVIKKSREFYIVAKGFKI